MMIDKSLFIALGVILAVAARLSGLGAWLF
jgi:hypothetical protein